MAKNQLTTEQIEEMKRKASFAQHSLDDLKATIKEMEASNITSIETTSVDQMNRAVRFLSNYASAARKAFMVKLHSKP